MEERHHQRGGRSELPPPELPIKPPKEVAEKTGILYSADGDLKQLVLMKGDQIDGEPGEVLALTEKAKVSINEVEALYGIADLRRNDKVRLQGDPIVKINASR